MANAILHNCDVMRGVYIKLQVDKGVFWIVFFFTIGWEFLNSFPNCELSLRALLIHTWISASKGLR